MRSMTGYGVGSAHLGDGQLWVEIRAINNRFLDVRVRVSEELSAHAFFLEQLARERLGRGRYEVTARAKLGAAEPRLSLERARELYRALAELRDEVTPGSEISLAALAAWPHLLAPTRHDDADSARGALAQALDAALVELDDMRRREGGNLRRALEGGILQALAIASAIEERASGASERQRARLLERLERLARETNVELDPGRLETEVVVLASRSDITEELVRLRSHFDQLAGLIEEAGPVGRKFEFLLQEVAREANTLSAKSQDTPIAHSVVEMKGEIEKLREQVQNVE